MTSLARPRSQLGDLESTKDWASFGGVDRLNELGTHHRQSLENRLLALLVIGFVACGGIATHPTETSETRPTGNGGSGPNGVVEAGGDNVDRGGGDPGVGGTPDPGSSGGSGGTAGSPAPGGGNGGVAGGVGGNAGSSAAGGSGGGFSGQGGSGGSPDDICSSVTDHGQAMPDTQFCKILARVCTGPTSRLRTAPKVDARRPMGNLRRKRVSRTTSALQPRAPARRSPCTVGTLRATPHALLEGQSSRSAL